MKIFKAIGEVLQMIFARNDPAGLERPSPQDWLPLEAITQDSISGDICVSLQPLVDRLQLSHYPILARVFIPDTNSMDWVFDYGNNPLCVSGATPEDHAKLVKALEVGSDAIYQKDDGGIIIHRVFEIKNGLYTFGGINNSGIVDKPDVRPDQIKYVSLGVID